MEASLTSAVKLHSIPMFLDKINSIGSPVVGNQVTGEGSSFLAIPTKRNNQPQSGSNSVATNLLSAASGRRKSIDGQKDQKSASLQYLDFKQALLPTILSAATPTDPWQNGTDILKSSLVPNEQHWYSLNQLRIHAGAPERSEQGIERLMQYYCQLCWLEERFPFETEQIPIEFVWFEAFFPKQTVVTQCIQYEKAAVMFNLGALYSQLGSSQSLWTSDGLKVAAQYFQRASGAFIYIRDTLFPRFKVRVDASNDLSDQTLTAASELMLAQAIECFYQKAEYDSTSSPVTSQIAAQTADFYDIAYKSSKQGNSFGKYRFPKIWISQMHCKQLIYTSMAHLHCPNFLSAETVVGERHSRLLLAKEIAQMALEKCALKDVSASPELRVLAASTLDKIIRVLDDVDKANYENFHQTVLGREHLKPLRRPPHALVSRINVVTGQGCGSIYDGIRERRFKDIFDGVIGVMCLTSGHASTMPRSLSNVEQKTFGSSKDQIAAFAGGNNRSTQSFVSMGFDGPIPEYRNSIDHSSFKPKSAHVSLNNVPAPIIDEIKRFVWDVKKFGDRWGNDLQAALTTLDSILKESAKICPADIPDNPKFFAQVVSRSKKLLSTYVDCQKIDHSLAATEICDKLKEEEESIEQFLNDINRTLWDNDQTRARQHLLKATESGSRRPSQAVDDLLSIRQLAKQVLNEWQDIGGKSHTKFQEIPVNLRKVRADTAALLQTMTDESFSELFVPKGHSDTQLYWSLSKIQTVVPCLDHAWQENLTKVSDNSFNLWSNLHQNRSSRTPPSFIIAYQESLVEFQIQAKKLEELRTSVDEALRKVTREQNRWYGSDLNSSITSQWISNSKNHLIENLLQVGRDIAKHQSNSVEAIKDYPNDILICMGIEKIRKDIQDLSMISEKIMDSFVVLSAPVAHKQGEFPVATRLNKLQESVVKFSESAMESDKIVSVFEEQLQKWKCWRADAQQQIEELHSVKNWLAHVFGDFGVPFHHQPAPRTQKQPDFNQDYQNFNRILNEQRRLEQAQMSGAERLANTAMHMLNTEWPQTTPPETRRNPSVLSPQIQRKQMLRKLSLTAAAIEKHAKDIEHQVHDQSAHVHTDLMIHQSELQHQLKTLHEQQQEFLRMNNLQIQNLQRAAGIHHVSPPASRGTHMLTNAKEKVLSFMRKQSKGPSTLEQEMSQMKVNEVSPVHQKVKPPMTRWDSGIGQSSVDLFAQEPVTVAAAYSVAPSAPPELNLQQYVAQQSPKVPKSALSRKQSMSVPRKPVEALAETVHTAPPKKSKNSNRRVSLNTEPTRTTIYDVESGIEEDDPYHYNPHVAESPVPAYLTSRHEPPKEEVYETVIHRRSCANELRRPEIPGHMKRRNSHVAPGGISERRLSKGAVDQDTYEHLRMENEMPTSSHVSPVKVSPSRRATQQDKLKEVQQWMNHEESPEIYTPKPSEMMPNQSSPGRVSVSSRRSSYGYYKNYAIPEDKPAYRQDPCERPGLNLKEKVRTVSRYLAYNRECSPDEYSADEEDLVVATKRGSLGGEPHIP